METKSQFETDFPELAQHNQVFLDSLAIPSFTQSFLEVCDTSVDVTTMTTHKIDRQVKNIEH